MSHWEAMLSHPNEWVEQWHILRPDADFRDVTKSSEDTLQASSYNVTRSSPDDDGETSDDDDGERNTSRPILVHSSGGDDDGEENTKMNSIDINANSVLSVKVCIYIYNMCVCVSVSVCA